MHACRYVEMWLSKGHSCTILAEIILTPHLHRSQDLRWVTDNQNTTVFIASCSGICYLCPLAKSQGEQFSPSVFKNFCSFISCLVGWLDFFWSAACLCLLNGCLLNKKQKEHRMHQQWILLLEILRWKALSTSMNSSLEKQLSVLSRCPAGRGDCVSFVWSALPTNILSLGTHISAFTETISNE